MCHDLHKQIVEIIHKTRRQINGKEIRKISLYFQEYKNHT